MEFIELSLLKRKEINDEWMICKLIRDLDREKQSLELRKKKLRRIFFNNLFSLGKM